MIDSRQTGTLGNTSSMEKLLLNMKNNMLTLELGVLQAVMLFKKKS